MKKRAKKLTLHRETLRSLDEGRLGRAAGGWGNTEHTFCATDCPWCPGETYTVPTEYTLCGC